MDIVPIHYLLYVVCECFVRQECEDCWGSPEAKMQWDKFKQTFAVGENKTAWLVKCLKDIGKCICYWRCIQFMLISMNFCLLLSCRIMVYVPQHSTERSFIVQQSQFVSPSIQFWTNYNTHLLKRQFPLWRNLQILL